MGKNDTIILRHDMWDALSELSKEEKAKYLTDFVMCIFDGVEIESKIERMVLRHWIEQVKKDRVMYERRCKANAENIKKRWAGNDDGGDGDGMPF